MSRHRREPGTLPRPLAVLGAIALAAGTAAAIRMLPADAEPRPARPPAAKPVATQVERQPRKEPFTGFVAFADAARSPALDLAAGSRRTGVRYYALGHVVAATGACAPAWAPAPTGSGATLPPIAIPDAPREAAGSAATPGGEPDAASGGASRADSGGTAATPTGRAGVPESGRTGRQGKGSGGLAERVRRLRAAGGDAMPVFGGPRGVDLAASCTRPGALAAAYRRVLRAFDATAADFEIRDSADRAAVLRRARAIAAVQRERPLRVSFTLPLGRDGLSAQDVAMLRATRKAGAQVSTVNLLAPIEPRATSPGGRLDLVAVRVHKAAGRLAQVHGLPGADEAYPLLALTPLPASADDLTVQDAWRLVAYATRHRLAWLSVRGTPLKPGVARVLWHTPSNR
ncbi:hypothetical protein [Nonomuraea sp. NPDC049309]|uniref:hypothetical protein n=1 Tax=Nonomuraea sp. NPDC049309 TaxID=3364350 RepID=UPI0037139B48